MNSSRSLLAALAAFTLSCGGGDDAAIELYGTTSGPTGQLVQLDPSTGALVRTIGPVGYQVNGLEWDHTTGKLLATTSFHDASFANGLLQIDLATGAGTPIGSANTMTIMNPTVSAAGQLYAWTEDTDDLVTLDKATGAATVVGDSLLDTWEHGLAFDGRNRLVMVNTDAGDLYTIDPASGASTPIGSLGVRAHHGDFHPATGMYWGLDVTASSGTPTRHLLVIDVDAETVTATHPTVDGLFAISFKR